MEFGIISAENFKDKTFYDIPVKRWDPLSTTKLFDSERFSGHYSYLSPIRGQRPKGFKDTDKEKKFYDCSRSSYKKYKDVFTSVLEGKIVHDDWGLPLGDGHTIMITQDEIKRENPFSDKPRLIEKIPETTKAVSLINRYPSMARIVDSEIEEEFHRTVPNHIRLAKGINLVTISRQFYPSLCLNKIPEEILMGIFVSMKEAILYCITEAIERNYYDIPVSPFFNIGKKVGGSQPRIHSQIYIDLNGDGHGSRLEGYLKAFKEMGNDCHLCKTSHGDTDRIILKTEFWTFYTTGSPVRNYHIRFHPNEHIRRFSQLKINQIRELARNLKIIFQALDEIGVERNRNILFNCCPYGYDSQFHLFGDIIPHEIIGGAEMADDMRVARKLPHIAASEIRFSIQNSEKNC